MERGAHIDRVVLDHELKSEYQHWLRERDKHHDDYDGHPDRTPDEIREWAHEHGLPYFDDEVHFPDVRVEYQEPDGRCSARTSRSSRRTIAAPMARASRARASPVIAG